jgi:hypothetical protein
MERIMTLNERRQALEDVALYFESKGRSDLADALRARLAELSRPPAAEPAEGSDESL